jgi:antitoxin (DNA-binding transcriptional repressor) of toxin-antitoxin stability system
MTNLSVSQLRTHISDFVSRAAYAGERFAIQKNGKAACAIVSMKDLELIEALEDQIDIEAAKKARRKKTSIPWEKAKKQLGL